MPNLASMVLAAFFFICTNMDMKGVPMPVVIENGSEYSYDLIYSAITVPLNWKGDCDNQRKFVYMMAEHFNAFRNGLRKKSEVFLNTLSDKWVCVI